MDVVRVRAGERPYSVGIGDGSLARAGQWIRDRLELDRVITVGDGRALGFHGEALTGSLRQGGLDEIARIAIPSGEGAKSLARARGLYQAFARAGADRSTAVIAFGGGVTGDLVGFAASTYMRGLPVVQIPTTVIAQVDSAVGGKTAVNFGAVKNLIGTFHQPRLVVIDPSLLKTLAARDFKAGLAEAVKVAVTLRPELMGFLEARTDAVLGRDPTALARVVRSCVEAKAEVVGRDERDRDVRAILNYGHTIGHAIEGASRGRIRHGEAVAIGMRAAGWIGVSMGVMLPESLARQDRLLDRIGLKPVARAVDKEEVVRNLKLDKKVHDLGIRFVLTLQIGGASVWPHVPAPLLRRAIERATG